MSLSSFPFQLKLFMDYTHYLPIIFILLLVIFHLIKRRRNLPPSPFALPIIGHLHLLRSPQLHHALEALSSKYGPILLLKLGFRPTLVVSSLSTIEECFTKNDITFANRPPTVIGDTLTYNYTALVWTPYGHLWRNLRRLMVIEIFSSTSLSKLSYVREEEAQNLLYQLFQLIGSGTRKVELRYFLSLFTFNSTMRTVTGKRAVGREEAGTEEGKRFLLQLRQDFVPSVSVSIVDYLPILRWIGYKGIEKRLIGIQKKRDELLQNMLDEIRQNKSSFVESANSVEHGKKMPLIETLFSHQKQDPDFYTEDVIKSLSLIMFVAGTDTAVLTLEWAISLLLNHPETMQKLRSEIDNHLKFERLLNESDLPNLLYLSCVIKETLRLYPTVPLLLPHFSSQDCTVGGFEVPRGTTLVVNVWALHRDPKVWEDPLKFMPERFNGEKEGFKFIPFGVGRRACPGAAMGMRMVSLALGLLIQCFDWERTGEETVDMSQNYGLSMSLAKPLEALCTPRQGFIKLLSQL